MDKIRVLVVDDSALMRKVMSRIINADPEMEVIATARDGEDGVLKGRELRPDVVTMDINMPNVDGITALQYFVEEKICPVVMVSSLTQEGALTTLECLELGAFDYVPKPGGTVSLNLDLVEDEIRAKVKAAVRSRSLSKTSRRVRPKVRQPRKRKPAAFAGRAGIAVALGISTGGPKTLLEVIPELPADLGASLFLVQHMPSNFTASFAQRLDQHAPFAVSEAKSGEQVEVDHGYLGKGGFHLLLRPNSSDQVLLRLSKTPKHLFMPSVDIMMESVLKVYGERTVGVLMTGMGDDGADSMVKIRQAGGITIAESEETAIVFGMPKEAIERGGAEIVAPSYEIAAEIVKAVQRLC